MSYIIDGIWALDEFGKRKMEDVHANFANGLSTFEGIMTQTLVVNQGIACFENIVSNKQILGNQFIDN